MRTWHGCYDEGWGDLIVKEAFAHPAKYAYGLIKRIIEHGLERGYWHGGGEMIVTKEIREQIIREIAAE